MNIRNDIGRFLKGFGHAFEGLIYCVKTQRNFRFHMGAAGAVLTLGIICRVSFSQALVLFLCVGGVMALECVNTAVESAVDLITKGERSPLAKAAKDCAAGGVLIFSAAAACVGVAVFFSKSSLSKITDFFKDSPIMLLAAVGYIVLWFLWVFVCFNNKDNNKDKDK